MLGMDLLVGESDDTASKDCSHSNGSDGSDGDFLSCTTIFALLFYVDPAPKTHHHAPEHLGGWCKLNFDLSLTPLVLWAISFDLILKNFFIRQYCENFHPNELCTA